VTSTGTGKLNKLNKLNNPYKTIQKGLNMASAGKTVFDLFGKLPGKLQCHVARSSDCLSDAAFQRDHLALTNHLSQ